MPNSEQPLYRCSKAGATVREGIELSSTKIGRLPGRSLVGIAQEKATADGVARAQLDGRGRVGGRLSRRRLPYSRSVVADAV